jgi:hypothetical protein
MKKLILGAEIFLATCVLAGGTVFAATVGTETDPLVSKSYVDNKIEQVLTLINNNGTGVSTSESASVDEDAIADKVIQRINNGELTGSTGTAVADSYTPVSVAVGQTIYGKEGTELILRAGKGKVVCNGVDGVADITTGSEMANGAPATKNHLMIIPRDDGRGIKITEAAWFLVKGDYEIK